MTEKKVEELIKTTLEDLLSKLEIKGELEITHAKDKEDESHYTVNIKTEETGLLIGFHGETLNSLQLLLGVILFKKLGVWTRVILDVGEYRHTREESIKEMVERIIAEVEAAHQPVILPFLTPLERRTVHIMLETNEKVKSESEGEGKNRRVVIKPKE